MKYCKVIILFIFILIEQKIFTQTNEFPNNRNHVLTHVPWSIVGRPVRKLNTYVTLIDNEGPLGFFQRIVE